MKNKNLVWIVAGVLIILVVASLVYFNDSKEEEVIKIAYVSALSGDAGIWGQSLKKGFDFGLNEYNQQESKKYTFEAVYEDDACDATTGINAFNKVINLQEIKYVTGTVCSNVAMSVSNIVNENNVIYIASGATNPAVVKQGDTIFRLWPDDSYDAKAIAEYAVIELNAKTFSIAHVNDNPAGISAKDSFKEIVEEFGNEVLTIEDHTSKETDFRTVAMKLIQNNPDAIYIASLPEQMPLFIKQIRDLNYQGKILLYGPSATSEGIIDKILVKEEIYYTLPDDVKQTGFWESYKEKTGEEADSLVALGYDSFQLIKDSIESCGNDVTCVKEFILSLEDYETSRGTFGFDQYGDVTQVPYKVIKVE